MESLLCLLLESFLPLELGTIGQQNKKLKRESQILLLDHGVMEGGATPISTPWLLEPPVLAMKEIVLPILDTDLEHIQPSNDPCSSPARYCHLPGIVISGTVTKFSKCHSTILSYQVLQDGGKYDKASEFHEPGPLSHFFCCAVSFMIRSNTPWNTMMMNKAFCNPRMVVLTEVLCAEI